MIEMWTNHIIFCLLNMMQAKICLPAISRQQVKQLSCAHQSFKLSFFDLLFQ